MTDQQPHTPTTEVIRETYIGEPPYTLYRYTEEEFDRWLDSIEAAAEQRGAAQALREAAIEISVRDGSTARGIIWSGRDSIVSWLLNRADQMEDDDE